MAYRETDRKGGGFRALGTALNKMTKPIFGKRGLADGVIAMEWPQIVGESLAKVTMPERISYPKRDRRDGTLYLKVAGGSFATELIHFEPQLIERINRYFGYQAVSRVQINQGPISRPPENQAPKNISAKTGRKLPETTELGGNLSSVSDPELLEALKSLGEAVHRRSADRHKSVTKT